MKEYFVKFSEPIEYTEIQDVFNKTTGKWEEKEVTKSDSEFTFYNLTSAKKFIKAHIDKYVSSSIYKIYSNGDFECLGSIKLSGTNKHFVANTKMKKSNY